MQVYAILHKQHKRKQILLLMRPHILDLFRVELYVKVSTMIREALNGIMLQTAMMNKKQINRGHSMSYACSNQHLHCSIDW
jgi:hypothetical protein